MEQTFDAPTETVLRISLDRITESPDNPRKTFHEADLQEMADSIMSQGVLQPIVVRELQNSLFAYEVVFGARRFRGSVKAGKADIPAIVRQMTDEEADLARLHENLEREDPHYIEEAEAMHRLMTVHGVTAADLAAQTGKKLTFVYGRLKLASLHPKVREMCLADIFSAEIATMIGRWPLAVQPAAAKACLQDAYGMTPEEKGKHAKSYRECKLALRSLAVPIARADFSNADATLPGPDGTPLACAYCPNNTVNDVALSEHFGPEAMCIFRPCSEKRDEENERRQVAAAKADARTVAYENSHSQPDLVRDNEWLGHKQGGWARELVSLAAEKGLATPAPTLVLSDDETIVGKMYPKAAIKDLQAQLFPAAEPAAGDDSGRSNRDAMEDEFTAWLEQQPPEARAVADGGNFATTLQAILAAAREAPRSAEELREVLMNVLEVADRFHDEAERAMGWPDDLDELDDPMEERTALLRGMSGDDLAALLVLDAICERFDNRIHPYQGIEAASARISDRLAVARRYGVDPLRPCQAIDPQPGSPASGSRTPAPSSTTTKGGGGAVKYRNSGTGDTWSGRGLQPKWLKAALAAGRTLADFEVGGAVNQSDDGRVAAGSDAEVAAS